MRFAGRATSAVEKIQRAHVAAEPDVQQRAVVHRQTRVSMTERAVVGGPFIVLIPVAFCAALLAQAQMVLELAVLAGHAADDETRVVELLVLQRVYPSEHEAQAALKRVKRDLNPRPDARLPRGTRWLTIKRMALLLGLLGSEEKKPSLIRTVLQWLFLGLLFLVSFVVPLVWAPYMAAAMRRSSLEIGDRAMRFMRTPRCPRCCEQRARRAGPCLRHRCTHPFSRGGARRCRSHRSRIRRATRWRRAAYRWTAVHRGFSGGHAGLVRLSLWRRSRASRG